MKREDELANNLLARIASTHSSLGRVAQRLRQGGLALAAQVRAPFWGRGRAGWPVHDAAAPLCGAGTPRLALLTRLPASLAVGLGAAWLRASARLLCTGWLRLGMSGKSFGICLPLLA